MLFNIEIHLNRRPDAGHYIHGHRTGDPLEAIGTFTTRADDATAAANWAWEFGNIGNDPGISGPGGITDTTGTRYPTTQRSLSKGDVLTITDPHGGTTTLAVAGFGWKHIDRPTNT